MFIIEHYVTIKSFAAVHRACSNAFPGNEGANKTTMHHKYTFQDTGNVCDKC